MAQIQPGISDLESARERLRNKVLETPVIRHKKLDQALGCHLYLKCENQQTTGAFKLRGASNAIAILREQGYTGDVATHSSGNHGAALALAARRDGRRAFVVMPSNAVTAKVNAVRHFGGEVIFCEPNQVAREAGLAQLVAEGLEAIPPYDDARIIAGQGSCALELMQQAPSLDILVAPLGGGGLLAGCALAVQSVQPDIKVIGAEPEGAADAYTSLQQGKRVSEWQPDTMADGLRAVIGKINFDIIKQSVDAVLLASEPALEPAMRQVFETTGMVIEPSSAVAIAVISEHAEVFKDQHVGVIISGGNIEKEQFPWLNQSPR